MRQSPFLITSFLVSVYSSIYTLIIIIFRWPSILVSPLWLSTKSWCEPKSDLSLCSIQSTTSGFTFFSFTFKQSIKRLLIFPSIPSNMRRLMRWTDSGGTPATCVAVLILVCALASIQEVKADTTFSLWINSGFFKGRGLPDSYLRIIRFRNIKDIKGSLR